MFDCTATATATATASHRKKANLGSVCLREAKSARSFRDTSGIQFQNGTASIFCAATRSIRISLGR